MSETWTKLTPSGKRSFLFNDPSVDGEILIEHRSAEGEPLIFRIPAALYTFYIQELAKMGYTRDD